MIRISEADWYQGLLVLFAGSAAWLIGNKGKTKKWGWLIGCISQPLWVFMYWEIGLWGGFLMTLFYCITWIRGLRNNWKREGANGK